MSTIDYTKREIWSRVLYLGGEHAGKATNLDYVYGLNSREPSPGRAYWELNGLELTLGKIRGFTTRLHLWPVVGAPFYVGSRKRVMGSPDENPISGIVWVIDSQFERLEAGEVMAEVFRDELAECGYDLAKLPVVMQYNKRDLPNAAPLAELQKLFNPVLWPMHEAVATTGVGVLDSLRDLTKQILLAVRDQ